MRPTCRQMTETGFMCGSILPCSFHGARSQAAWLIEMNGVLLCYSKDGSCYRWVGFSDPAACRFATQADAEKVIAEHALPATAVEHLWLSGPPHE